MSRCHKCFSTCALEKKKDSEVKNLISRSSAVGRAITTTLLHMLVQNGCRIQKSIIQHQCTKACTVHARAHRFYFTVPTLDSMFPVGIVCMCLWTQVHYWWEPSGHRWFRSKPVMWEHSGHSYIHQLEGGGGTEKRGDGMCMSLKLSLHLMTVQSPITCWLSPPRPASRLLLLLGLFHFQ